MATDAEFLAAIEAAPADGLQRHVYADWLQEQGRDAEAKIQRTLGDWDSLCVTPLAEVVKALDRANGKRRVRTLDLSDVVRDVLSALTGDDGWDATGGGTVANAYRYPAEQTICLAARRTDGRVRVAVGTNGAKKGASLTNPLCGLTVKAKPEQFRGWADAVEAAVTVG